MHQIKRLMRFNFLFYWYLHKIEMELRVEISKNFTLHSKKKNVISKHGSFMNDETYNEFFAWFMSRFLKKENITIPTNLCDMFLLSHIFDSCDEWYLNIKDDWCLWFSSVSYWYLSVRVSPLYLCFLGREVGCLLVALNVWRCYDLHFHEG